MCERDYGSDTVADTEYRLRVTVLLHENSSYSYQRKATGKIESRCAASSRQRTSPHYCWCHFSRPCSDLHMLWSLKDSLHGQTFECYSGHKWPVWTARWKALHWLHKALECRWEKMHCAWRGLCRTTIKWLCTWSTVSMFFSLHAEQPSYMQEILLGHHQKQQQQPYYCVYDWMLLSVSQCSNCQSM